MTAARRLTGQERLAELDNTHCVVRYGGKTRIFTWETSAVFPGTVCPAFYNESDLKLYFLNEFIVTRDAEGNDSRKPIFPFWLRRAQCPRARGLVIDPKAGRFSGAILNLWCGFGVESKPGTWPLLRTHIEKAVCAEDAESSAYLFKWMAWVLQNPEKHAEVAVVMRGKKGSGKGTLARLLLRIFATHGLHISNRDHLTGRFNSHLMHCCLLFLDEAIWPGDKNGEGVLKRVVTEPTLTVEPKGVDAMEAVNRLAIIMASNESWVVPAGNDERRYACFDVADIFMGDHAHFAALTKEIEKQGGAEAFLHDMLSTDLGEWHPREDVPQTAALANQKQESAGPELQWLWQILEDGALPRYARDEFGTVGYIRAPGNSNAARSGLLYRHAKSSDGRLRFWSIQKFRTFLADLGVVPRRKTAGMFLFFPSLSAARAKFLELYPWYTKFTDGDGEWCTDAEYEIPTGRGEEEILPDM